MAKETDIEIDTALTAEAAVRDHQLAKERLVNALRAEASACTETEHLAAKTEVKAASREDKVTRVNAQYAVKRATGLFPYELALMGL